MVVDRTGAPIEYAEIQLRDPADHPMLASTFADAKGRFAFADKKRGTQLEIRVSRNGFNILQYTLTIVAFGRDKIRVMLPVAA